MALESASRPSTPDAQTVGNAFVEQYYHILHTSPEWVVKFYQEPSVISRPDSNGVMTSVTTMAGINEKILSLNYNLFKAEIKTADAQKSYKDGVIVVVTGSLMGNDNLKRNFTQSFFLAPQNDDACFGKEAYFVLNDVFRFVEDGEPLEPTPVNDNDDSPVAPLTPEPEPPYVSDRSMLDSATSIVEDKELVVEETQDTLNEESQLIEEKAASSESRPDLIGKDASPVAEAAFFEADDAPKKSYASIVSAQSNTSRPQAMKINTTKNKVHVPIKKVVAVKTVKQPLVSIAPPPVPETSNASGIIPHERNNSHDEVEGYSIYVRNLPFNVTVSELEVAFRNFGPIKQGGIQVRSHKHVGHCFGFVEFLSASSMEDAIQSPVTVGGHQAIVEIKKTSARVGRFPSGRGGFYNDGFRGRGNNSGSRGYGRNDYNNQNQDEFSGRVNRGPPGPGRGGGTGTYQQGRGRSVRPIRSNQTTA